MLVEVNKIIIKRFKSFHRAIANYKMDFLRPWEFIGQRNQYICCWAILKIIKWNWFIFIQLINKFKMYGNDCNIRLLVISLAHIQWRFTKHHTPNPTMQCNYKWDVFLLLYKPWFVYKLQLKVFKCHKFRSQLASMQSTRRLSTNKAWYTFAVLELSQHEQQIFLFYWSWM